MSFRFRRVVGGVMAAVLLVFGGQMLTGCSKDAEISKSEEAQIKQGPPKEMPAAAREMFNKASNAGGPPPQAGPPK